MSTTILPARLASPAARSASTDASPLVALITISPWLAVSLREPTLTPAPAAHAATFSALRELTITSCPPLRQLRRQCLSHHARTENPDFHVRFSFFM